MVGNGLEVEKSYPCSQQTSVYGVWPLQNGKRAQHRIAKHQSAPPGKSRFGGGKPLPWVGEWEGGGCGGGVCMVQPNQST